MMKMTPKQLRHYIDTMRLEHLRLKHDIEACEFELEQNQCPECYHRLTEELDMMMVIAEETCDLPQAMLNLEEFLAEDEALNGWKGKNRYVELPTPQMDDSSYESYEGDEWLDDQQDDLEF